MKERIDHFNILNSLLSHAQAKQKNTMQTYFSSQLNCYYDLVYTLYLLISTQVELSFGIHGNYKNIEILLIIVEYIKIFV